MAKAKVTTIKGSSTGRSYNVGQKYTSGGYTYEAMADGKFKRLGRAGAQAAAPATTKAAAKKVTSAGSGGSKTKAAAVKATTYPKPNPGAAGTPTGTYRAKTGLNPKGGFPANFKATGSASGFPMPDPKKKTNPNSGFSMPDPNKKVNPNSGAPGATMRKGPIEITVGSGKKPPGTFKSNENPVSNMFGIQKREAERHARRARERTGGK
jgi:hypothetical protein